MIMSEQTTQLEFATTEELTAELKSRSIAFVLVICPLAKPESINIYHGGGSICSLLGLLELAKARIIASKPPTENSDER
jgi:hypothetical protein